MTAFIVKGYNIGEQRAHCRGTNLTETFFPLWCTVGVAHVVLLMSDRYTCNDTNIAGSSVHILMALVVCLDIVVREIPPLDLIANGRIGVGLFISFDFAVAVLTATDASGKESGRFAIGIIPAARLLPFVVAALSL